MSCENAAEVTCTRIGSKLKQNPRLHYVSYETVPVSMAISFYVCLSVRSRPNNGNTPVNDLNHAMMAHRKLHTHGMSNHTFKNKVGRDVDFVLQNNHTFKNKIRGFPVFANNSRPSVNAYNHITSAR